MTEDDYDNLILVQHGLCPICEEELPEYDCDDAMKAPHIDHDHSCCPGKESCGLCIRGVLHAQCNRFLALVEKVNSMNTKPFDLYLEKGRMR